MRARACTLTLSSSVGPGRAMPSWNRPVLACTKPSGTNSVKPPVSFWMSRSRMNWLIQCSGVSRWPYIRVEVVGMPSLLSGAHHVGPLLHRYLLARQHVPNVVVQNLGGGARQGVQAVVLQHLQVVVQRHAGQLGAVRHLHGGEGVRVHVRHRSLDGAQDVAVIKGVQTARQPALHADLGGAPSLALPRYVGRSLQTAGCRRPPSAPRC